MSDNKLCCIHLKFTEKFISLLDAQQGNYSLSDHNIKIHIKGVSFVMICKQNNLAYHIKNIPEDSDGCKHEDVYNYMDIYNFYTGLKLLLNYGIFRKIHKELNQMIQQIKLDKFMKFRLFYFNDSVQKCEYFDKFEEMIQYHLENKINVFQIAIYVEDAELYKEICYKYCTGGYAFLQVASQTSLVDSIPMMMILKMFRK